MKDLKTIVKQRLVEAFIMEHEIYSPAKISCFYVITDGKFVLYDNLKNKRIKNRFEFSAKSTAENFFKLKIDDNIRIGKHCRDEKQYEAVFVGGKIYYLYGVKAGHVTEVGVIQ